MNKHEEDNMKRAPRTLLESDGTFKTGVFDIEQTTMRDWFDACFAGQVR